MLDSLSSGSSKASSRRASCRHSYLCPLYGGQERSSPCGLHSGEILLGIPNCDLQEYLCDTEFRFNSAAGILGGIFAYGIGQWHVRAGMHLYQYIYITYGSFTTAWGIMLFFVLPDSPATAWFLNHEEKLAAMERVKGNQTGMINRRFKRDQFVETILDPKTWVYALFTFIGNIPNGGLNAFSTLIIKGFGFSKSSGLLML